MDNNIYWLWFTNIKGLGYRRRRFLLETFLSPEAIFLLEDRVLLDFLESNRMGAAGLEEELKRSKQNLAAVERYHGGLLEQGIRTLSLEDPEYPRELREIHAPPHVLYLRGTWPKADLRVGIVGSRRSTQYGRQTARILGKELAKRGVCVVSGMAVGIDGEAHWGALEGGGETVAVLGSGVLECYPPSNRNLMERIIGQGAVLSEEPVHAKPVPGLFPKRNRIISGLCRGLVVVEAAHKSGSLITAHDALEQGRDVFAVPGRWNDAQSEGANRLIQAGAKMVLGVEDILEELGIGAGKQGENSEKIEKTLDEREKMVYSCMSLEPIFLDRILSITGLQIGDLMLCLMQLELKALVEALPNRYYVRCP
ncbi:DNA-processing protein DprA [Anaerotalea alkaliphila]|uniref:DNA-protecting protein DprA n=1 Tax=Anaerotalea alkaliphila TaxID=2662126 RepID=A0A7X5KMV4_9FIRM|nr:DNA-processing protein DprA [Anaerotalea alkaliphila]NDL66152.1 DNA-protecting protein DprA [Anaerotalea alkaliphila]